MLLQKGLHQAKASCKLSAQRVPVCSAVHQQRSDSQLRVPEQRLENESLSRRSAIASLISVGALTALPIHQASAESATAVESAAAAPIQAPVDKWVDKSKIYNSPMGFTIGVPPGWVVAYDRSDKLKNGVLLLCGNFQTVDTISIARLSPSEAGLPEGATEIDEESAAKVVESLVAEQRDSGKALTFKMYGTRQRTTDSGATFWDAQYLLEICNGRGQEVTAGKKICLSPTNMELETVSRINFLTFALIDGGVYVVKGACRSDRWKLLSRQLVASVQSFQPPATVPL